MIINKYQKGSELYTHIHFESLTKAMQFYKDIREGRFEYKRSSNRSKGQEYTSDSWHRKNGSDWTGYSEQKDFEHNMKYGDLEKAKVIWDLATPELIVQSIRRRVHYGEQGDELDIHRVYRGEFDKAWRYTKKQKALGGSRNITILVNLGANCNITSEDLGWRGIASLKIADTLTNAGYNVRLLGYSVGLDDCNNKTHNALTTVPIKDFDEGLDVTKLAAIMCRGAFFRTVIFAARTVGADKNDLDVSSGLGRSSGLDDSNQGKFFREKAYAEEGELISLPTVEGKEATLKAMKDILDKFSIQE